MNKIRISKISGGLNENCYKTWCFSLIKINISINFIVSAPCLKWKSEKKSEMKSTNLKTKLFCFGVILLILSVITESQYARPVRETRKRFCGKMLKETLGLLCKDKGYNTISKKSSNSKQWSLFKFYK